MTETLWPRRIAALILIVALILPGAAAAQSPDVATPVFLPAVSGGTAPAQPAAHTPDPTSVTLVGSLQSEAGCAADWDPACAASALTYDATDQAWQASFALPAGSYEYKVALNGSWDENYGVNASPGGANIPLTLAADASVKFYYEHESHWITSNRTNRIVTVPGSYQQEIGCSGDWQPDCLRSWLLDPDGDGTATRTVRIDAAGSYEAKAAINEAWDENYGAGGAPGGANIPFTLDGPSDVTFSFENATNVLTISIDPVGGPDNNIEWDGLGHNSHDTLYRVPFGAVTPGTEVTLRFRTFAGDVTDVRARIWDDGADQQIILPLEPAATDVSCYDDALADRTCDFWEARYTPASPTVLFYRFLITDGTRTVFYADDAQRDGGWGRPSDTVIDDGYVVTVYDAAFQPVEWMQDAVVYQIFPDRFRNGSTKNDPRTTEPRYGFPPEPLDQILLKPWSALPEGYCRHYEGQEGSDCDQAPRGRDYFGGDLHGVQERLTYLQALGVTAIYFNPIFEAASNHAYDTQDYYTIDHFFGTNKEFALLAREAQKRGIRIILDGVFNHVSSDSAYFDRYGHFATVGACESVDSPYRSWFTFRADPAGPCAGPNGTRMNYDAWFGFDSLPVLDKSNPQVQELVYGPNGVAQFWLKLGADGWRLDVMGDPSFPDSFWREFRTAVKTQDPNAVIIGELWKKFEVLPKSLGDIADTSMNYRFRNAILGYFGQIDFKGFPDDGQSFQPPTTFANKLISVREDYPDATYTTLMNILDSHDTQRILWSLTPGARTRADRELNTANVAVGKNMLRLATVVQMTTPGAPTIYYGDEVGVTGEDDPDDRRTFPWLDAKSARGSSASADAVAEAVEAAGEADIAALEAEAAALDASLAADAAALEAAGSSEIFHFGDGWSSWNPFRVGGDTSLLAHYARLTWLRKAYPAFRDGELSFLLLDDANSTMAYLMRTEHEAALVAINRNATPQTLAIPLDGKLPRSARLWDALGRAGIVTANNGVLTLTLPAYGASILLPMPRQDITAPAAPATLVATNGDGEVALSWSGVGGAAETIIYRSPVQGGGYVEIGRSTTTGYSDGDVENGVAVYYVVRAVDAAGNLGPASNEAAGLPRYTIGWANLQWPPTIEHTISAVNRTPAVYGQVWIDGVTSAPGATPTLLAQAGFGPVGADASGAGWTWVDAAFNTDAGNNDEFQAGFLPEAVGSYDYLYRYSTTGGAEWLYAGLSGPQSAAEAANRGKLTVVASSDTTPPAAPANLRVTDGSPAGIALAWDAVTGDATLYGYEVLRAATPAGPFTFLARVTTTTYTDANVVEGAGYSYLVRALDSSFNRSADSNIVTGVAARRLITLTVTVAVPASTDGTGRTVNIAGTLNRLEGGLPEWNPAATPLTRVDATTWTIQLQGYEGTELEYKYALGSWDYVEKGAACEETANRRVTLSYGTNGTQTVNDTVPNWRNVSPCGN